MGVRIPFIEIMWKIERLVGYPEYVYVDNIKGGNEKVMEIVDRNFKKEKNTRYWICCLRSVPCSL